jgi:hypothetical protein
MSAAEHCGTCSNPTVWKRHMAQDARGAAAFGKRRKPFLLY